MKVRRNEFMIGLRLSIAAVIVIFTILWLGKSNFFMKGVSIHLMVQDANGITSGDQVFYRGLKVGNVTDATITKHGVLLKLKIEDADKIPVDSKFEIGNFNVLSGTVVAIMPGSSPICFSPGDTVKGYAGYGMNQAVAGLQTLESEMSRVLSNVDTLTGDATRRQIDSVLTNLNQTIRQLNAQVNGNLKQTLTSVEQITSDNRENIALLIRSLSDNSDHLSAFLKISSRSAEQLDSLLTNLNEGKGSVGHILKSDSLYRSLNSTISSIDSLVSDIKAHPKKYVSVSVF
jgi:phospholipid/cholesterol/gamma-HCH transport system substrate-binding protein